MGTIVGCSSCAISRASPATGKSNTLRATRRSSCRSRAAYYPHSTPANFGLELVTRAGEVRQSLGDKGPKHSAGPGEMIGHRRFSDVMAQREVGIRRTLASGKIVGFEDAKVQRLAGFVAVCAQIIE